jgi:Asp-tRNA(Asn)/Glu-tRNA(Gln) amidotransferase A subunit family amidase
MSDLSQDPFVRKLLHAGQSHSAVRVKQTEFVRTQMRRLSGPVLERYDVPICPVLAVPAVAAEHRCDDESLTIDGKPADPFLMWRMTYPFNLVSQRPVASVPSGFASSGVPAACRSSGRRSTT